MTRVLIALDKFKGSIPASAAGEALARGILQAQPQWKVDLCPIADGGEGTTEALVCAAGGEWRSASVVDALGRPSIAKFGICGADAVMEMSAASGLAMVLDKPLNPQQASTFGTGQMLRSAMAEPAVERIIIGIGGSATNDGGAGMARALGFVFRDAAGAELTDLPAQLDALHAIEVPSVGLPRVLVACDVTNPMLGPSGATRVYGPQKGVTEPAWFEQRLERLADVAEAALGRRCRDVPGAGAAGGLGWGLMCFCGAELVSGADLVAKVTSLAARIAEADIVITGEGRLDDQTLCGKGPAAVAAMARAQGKRCIGIAGAVAADVDFSGSFAETHAIKPEDMSVAESMSRAAELLEAAGRRWADSA
jgi:glycerate 2-kinase